MAATPRWNIGDLVYIQASAKLGFLESYKVDSLRKIATGWVYTIDITQKPPAETTISDSVDLKQDRCGGPLRHLYFNESELITMQEALILAINNLEIRKNKLQATYDKLFPGTSA